MGIGITKRIGVTLASLIGMGVLAVAPMSPAEAAPAPAPQHGSYQNGCSWSPDAAVVQGVYYNFHNACDWHDLCYHYHWYSRLGCDDRFHSKMRSWCASVYDRWYESYHKSVCYGVAYTYYRAVRTFGGSFY